MWNIQGFHGSCPPPHDYDYDEHFDPNYLREMNLNFSDLAKWGEGLL